MAKWYKINDIKVVEVSDTSVIGWYETSNDNVVQGWWFQNGDVADSYTYGIDALREARDLALTSSDWTQLPNSPLTDSKKAEWATYRQELRDFPASHTTFTVTLDGTDTVWPVQPS